MNPIAHVVKLQRMPSVKDEYHFGVLVFGTFYVNVVMTEKRDRRNYMTEIEAIGTAKVWNDAAQKFQGV